MFGKKEKKQSAPQQITTQPMTTQQMTTRQVVPQPTGNSYNGINGTVPYPVYVQPEQKIFYESELINDNNEDEVVEIDLRLNTDAIKPAQPVAEKKEEKLPVIEPVKIPVIVEPVIRPKKEQPPKEEPRRERPRVEEEERVPRREEPSHNPNNNIIYLTNNTYVAPPQNQAPPEPREIIREIYRVPEERVRPEEPKEEPTPKPAPQPEPQSEPQPEPAPVPQPEPEPVVEPEPEKLPEPQPEPQPEPEPEEEPEVKYVVGGPEEDDEVVKPAKLVKLPNLVDYMLNQKMSKRMKMTVATLLLGAYAKFKDDPQEKELLIGCMKKIMQSLVEP